MAAEKLYYLDSHMTQFTARVLSCVPGKHGFDVRLDRTAFYPEGGGQPGDRGTLGGAAVTDTHEADGDIVHYCDRPLPVGETVEGAIDRQWRFDLMQHHSGEHILSGLIHAAYGYDNVGFHMGRDAVTIDFNGMLDEAALAELERKTNEIIWQDREVRVCWPDAGTLSTLPYRSKKALSGDVRIVEFPGADLCACCGTHVKRTGEIGLLKILSCVKFHDGVRLEILAGRRAMEYLTKTFEQNRRISGLLSAKPLETAQAAARLQQELEGAKYRLGQLEDRLFARQAAAYENAGDVLLFEEGLKPDSLRRLADAVMRACGGRAAVFSQTESGWQYAIGQEAGDLRAFTKEMNAVLNGRGGGKPGFVQGSVRASRAEIEAFFQV